MGMADDDMEGMMLRHTAPLPGEYAALTNPVPTNPESLERGRAIYDNQWSACHGDDGDGIGPAADNLSPAPAPVGHTAAMLSDGYVFLPIPLMPALFGLVGRVQGQRAVTT